MRSWLLFFAIPLSCSIGAEIRWTGSGTVSAVSGAGFAGFAAAGDPVGITLVFDTATQVAGRSYLPINGSLAGRAWFYGQASLAITVTVGDTDWRGEMSVVPAETNVMESVCWDLGGQPDWFRVTLDAARGGTYPAFPYSGGGTARSLEIEFRDDVAPAELFSIHQLPDTLSCLPQLTSASGAVRAGADSITFVLAPSTIRVSQPLVPVSIARVPEGIELSWPTEEGKNYRLESTSNLKCWVWEGEFGGDGSPIRERSNPFATDARRFYRVVEN